MGFLGADDERGHDGALGLHRHSNEAPLEFLQLVHLARGFEISFFAFRKKHDQIVFLKGLKPILVSGLGESQFLSRDRSGFGQKPKMVSEDSRDSTPFLLKNVSQDQSVETRIAGMVRRDDRSSSFRNVFDPFDLQPEILAHDLHEKMGQDSVNESVPIEVFEIENLLLRLFEKVDHMGTMYIMAIDQGTTGTTVSILSQAGAQVAKVNEEYPQIFPKPGWVEHDPEAIWKSVRSTIEKALGKSNIPGSQIAAIGITNQRETVLLWDRDSGKPISNAIVWQDRRTHDFCEKLKKNKQEKLLRKKTGLVIDPYFSASKIRWILKNVHGASEKARRGELLAGNIDSFLLWRLTAGKAHKTDVSNASRTQLMNIQSGQWDEELLKMFSVPRSILPEIQDSSGEFGRTKGLGILPDGIPISGIAGDQQAALFGQTCFSVGEAKCTFGTGSFLLMNTGSQLIFSKHQMLSTVAWRLPRQKMTYALEGGAFVCGAAVQWLRDGLQIISKSSEVEELARQVPSSEGVEFVPALTGLGAPHWKADARGIITGLTRGTTKAHLARATLEAMALQNTEILRAMEKDLGRKLRGLRVDGGASINNLLMQMQADYTGASVTRPKQIETTSIGAAYLAGLGVGFWSSLSEIKKIWMVDQEFKAEISLKAREARLDSWKKTIAKA